MPEILVKDCSHNDLQVKYPLTGLKSRIALSGVSIILGKQNSFGAKTAWGRKGGCSGMIDYEKYGYLELKGRRGAS